MKTFARTLAAAVWSDTIGPVKTASYLSELSAGSVSFARRPCLLAELLQVFARAARRYRCHMKVPRRVGRASNMYTSNIDAKNRHVIRRKNRGKVENKLLQCNNICYTCSACNR